MTDRRMAVVFGAAWIAAVAASAAGWWQPMALWLAGLVIVPLIANSLGDGRPGRHCRR